MSFVLLYFVRMTLISGCLYAYYGIFLHNASFHSYNRCYLLGISIFALILPFIQIPMDMAALGSQPFSAIAVLHKITTGDWEESQILNNQGPIAGAFFGGKDLAYLVYSGISFLFFTHFFRRILYISRLSRQYPGKRFKGILIYLTDEPGTPFSFFKMIFWNNKLDRNSSAGKQIFRHELYHVRQNHSLDILLLEFLRRLFWFNPFFHLISKEIKATHEFLADRYASSGVDKYEYAELLVWQSIGTHSAYLTNSFFNTHLKRRITMLTQSNNHRSGYFSRILVLPLAFLLFCAFATNLKKQNLPINSPILKTITLVVDAGHGGIDHGAVSNSGVNEKDLTLEIARKIKQLSPAYAINVLMTRDEDQLPGNKTTIQEGLHYRTDFARDHQADLFISLHVNAGSVDNNKGIEVYLSSKNEYFQKSKSLGSAVLEEMKKTYITNDQIRQREENIWVLKESAMPAIIVLLGNLDDSKDLSFISNDHNQETIARNLLQAVLDYEKNSSNQ
jgi:N-acetylmuramoyl-L-alanine amidase